MNSFVTGMLTSQAIDGTIETYWLKMHIDALTELTFFDYKPLSANLHVGQYYEMLLLVTLTDELSYSPAAPSKVSLNALGRTVRMTMNGNRAIPEKLREHISPIRAIILDPVWRPDSSSYLATVQDFRDSHYLLLETAFGRMLMHPVELENREDGPIEHIQAGAYLEWKWCRLDVLAVSEALKNAQSIMNLNYRFEIISYPQEIVTRMIGLPLLDILHQDVETWNAWREAVSVQPSFPQIDLSRQMLSSINLAEANLINANFHQANLSRANLNGANLAQADLSLANLSGTQFCRADLMSADLHTASLREASLSRADLSFANLIDADLTGADLSAANFFEANLTNANLTNTNLGEADFTDAILDGANLSGAIYTEEQLAQAKSAQNLQG